MLRKIVTSSMLLAAVPLASSAQKAGSDATPKRPTDLPIYNHADEKKATDKKETSAVRNSIESGIKVVRETCCDCVKIVQVQKKPIDDFVSTGIEHSQFIYDFLNEPANGKHRAGAIAIGALSGYIIGIRSGFIRRLLFTTMGGLGVASVCYPKEASVYSQQAIVEAKTCATIVFNFAYGVKPGDEPKPIPIPSSLSQLYGTVSKFFSSNKKSAE